MGEKLKKFIQKQSDREADELMELINQDPELADVHAPDEMGEALFAQIEAYEEARSQNKLSAEERELIELGKVFKKRRKVRKYVAAALIAILAMSFGGITVMGGPEKVIEVVEKWIAGGEETRINSDDERIESVQSFSEEEAYEKVKEEFGFDPVAMHYLPDGIRFAGCEIYEDAQIVNMVYQGENENLIMYSIYLNYNMSSTGYDVDENIVLEEYTIKSKEIPIKIQRCQQEGDLGERWYVDFEYNQAYYYYQFINLDKDEVELIIKEMYFE